MRIDLKRAWRKQEIRHLPKEEKRSVLHFILVALQVALILAALFYVTWQNSFLSSDWWVVALRDIDDSAINGAAEYLRRELETGGWKRAMSFFAYAYGLGFWFLMVVLTHPLHLLDVGEIQILLGRGLSLTAVFSTSLVVALIGRKIYPDKKGLWLVALGIGLLTPMSLINATKMHVNGWMSLFGALAIFFLVYQGKLSIKFLYLAAVFMGLAIGFKLTALALLPVFLTAVYAKRRDVGMKHVWGSYLAVPTCATLSGFPVLILSPVMPEAANYVLGVLSTFSGLGGGVGGSGVIRSIDGLGFFGSPVVLLALIGFLLLSSFQSRKDHESPIRWSLPFSIGVWFVCTWIVISVVIDKPSQYLATYSLSLAVFLPLGVFALAHVSSRLWVQIFVGWGLVIGNLFLSTQFSGIVGGSQNYAAIASSPSIERKLNAAKEISFFTEEVGASTSVLLDAHSVFPLSSINNEVFITMSYGDLDSFTDHVARGGIFEFIVLDSHSYLGMPNAEEDSLRTSLREDGKIWSANYELIYSNFGTLVYRLVAP